jgi:hypothetical protein
MSEQFAALEAHYTRMRISALLALAAGPGSSPNDIQTRDGHRHGAGRAGPDRRL